MQPSRSDSDATNSYGESLALNRSSPSRAAVKIFSPIDEMDSECDELMEAEVAASATQMSIFENESSTSVRDSAARVVSSLGPR